IQRRQVLRSKPGECRRIVDAWLLQMRDDLGLGSLPRDRPSDQWLVSDFWLDVLLQPATAIDPPEAPFLDTLGEVRSQVVAPTFVVVPQGWGLWADSPVLAINPADRPEAMAAEVLAACQASRSGA